MISKSRNFKKEAERGQRKDSWYRQHQPSEIENDQGGKSIRGKILLEKENENERKVKGGIWKSLKGGGHPKKARRDQTLHLDEAREKVLGAKRRRYRAFFVTMYKGDGSQKRRSLSRLPSGPFGLFRNKKGDIGAEMRRRANA